MERIARVGISLDEVLLKSFDALSRKRGYANRSEAIRDLIRRELVRQEWAEDGRNTMGVVCLVYDHDRMSVGHRLTHLQHDHHTMVVSAMHIHVDAENCLEVLVLRGKGKAIRALSDRLIGAKGVKYGELVTATTGAAIR